MFYSRHILFCVFIAFTYFIPVMGTEHEKSVRKQSGYSQSKPKPTLLYFSSQKNEDDSLAGSKQLEVSRLEACGFDVRDMEVKNLGKFNSQLLAGNFPSDIPVFVSASHGGGKLGKQGKEELRIDPSGYDVSGAQLIDSIRSIAPQSSIYMDVCHAGLCRDGKCKGMGTSCSAGQSSYPLASNTDLKGKYKFPVTQAMIDLYCDTIDQCQEVKAYDQNQDKLLSGDEINAYILQKLNGKKEFKAILYTFNSWREAKSENERCEAQKFHFTCSENMGYFLPEVSSQNQNGQWKKKNIGIELMPAGVRGMEERIPTGTLDEPSFSDQKLSAASQALISKKWPHPSAQNANQLIRVIMGFEKEDFPGPYQISESGLEIFGKNSDGKPFRYRLDNMHSHDGKFLLECKCISNELIPTISTDYGLQQVYFDPTFTVRCLKK